MAEQVFSGLVKTPVASLNPLKSTFTVPFTGIDVDNFDNVYLTGETNSSDFPITAGVIDTVYSGTREAMVVKYSR